MNKFVNELRQYRHVLPRQTISTLKGQALSGDVDGAKKGLITALNKRQSKSEIFTNAHRSARYIIKNYKDTDYKTQFALSLKGR